MNLNISSLGLVTLYTVSGSFAALVLVLLSVSATTPFYSSIITAAEKSPIISLLATLPFVILLGILADTGRVLLSTLFRRKTYHFDLPNSLKSLASSAIAQTLHINTDQVEWKNDSQFVCARQIVLPSFDQYKIHERWLHDLFLNSIFISGYALLVITTRLIASSVRSVDWLITVICLAGLIFALRLDSLKKAYTAKEVCLLIHQQGLQSVPKGPTVAGEDDKEE